MTSNKFVIALLLVLAVIFSVHAQDALQPYEAVEPHMGTLFRINLYAPDEASARQAFQAAFHRIDELDKSLSDYREDSELSRISREAVNRPVRVSEDLFRVVQASQQLSMQTQGAFDLTIGPLSHLWRQARRNGALPNPEAVQSARARCGYAKMHVDATQRTVEFDQPDMLLDPGGIGKGYAADEALAAIESLGLHSALVAASGDLAFGDAPPDQPGWKIGIDSFDRADKPFTRVLMLSNAAVSTSGNSEQHLTVRGQTYSHIIDPKTGMGLQDDLTVTTIAHDGITADPAATAISVLGCEKGMAFAAREPGLAAFIVMNKEGHARSFESASFRDLVLTKSF